MRRWPTQTKTASTRSRETPKSSNCAGHHPRKQGNVQTRNTHQMRDTRGPEKIPIRSLNGSLVAHDQCRNHASHGPALCISRQQFFFNFRPNVLPSLCYGVKPRCLDFLRRFSAFACQHRACGHDPLFPTPQSLIKAPRIERAMGRFEAHIELPCVACFESSPMTACHPINCFSVVPSKINPLWHQNIAGCTDLQSRLNLKPESHTA